ncbi:disease resistance protein Roq1-like [Cryptomeria japonica]|uniref:disease resistance protein Roq1-like n=1 Tax=Cryptomeria japonica TaxID=3369 RepID=UPI0027DA05A4|nr:disease resistance protein Roq1-like [Cryptomeria japonica]
MDSISFGGWEEENEIGNGFERSASSATTSSSAMRAYDVFINHRGIDTKRTIASTIYHTLDCMGLRVFLDKEELQLGDFLPATINYAMRSASLHIAIFSKKYAQSPWCLAELSFMLKTGTKIIPIFYDVQPRDLRWVGRGGSIYASSFAQHEKSGRYSSLQLDQWKSALHNVSFYCGWELNKLNNDEGRLLKNIVNVVLEVVKNVPLEVAKHPVGLDETVADFEEAAFKSVECTENVKIVGIVGMGGCGKTTLAKDLYNRKISSFQGSSFLFDVRDAAAKNMLHKLQKKLLEDLLHVTGLTFDSISQGKGVLAYRLRFIRVLIVLDDIDHMDQIDALLPAKDNLGAGSLIIVTTRDMEVLTCSSIKSIYKMGGLDRSNARQIFCWHAFLQPCPTHGFEDLVEQFLNACNGLPLSLKVLGGHLYGKSKVYWKSQLQKISRILPDNIKQKLRVSYDALDEEEQEIFLDIACFFIGEKKGLAITIWDGSGWSGLHSLETLVNKSLVELDYRNHIRMHDHLRDLGREIATKQTPCRFWFQFQKQPKRWPCEMTIAGRAVRNVDSIVNSLAFPNLNVVDKLTLVEDASMVQDGWWMLQFPETCLRNATAIIIFFVVHCYQDTSFLVSVRRELDGLSGSSCSSMRLRQGKWLYIGVFAEGSLLMEDLKNSFVDAIEVDHQPEKYVIEKGMAVIMSKGKECKRVHAFYQILALLEHCH